MYRLGSCGKLEPCKPSGCKVKGIRELEFEASLKLSHRPILLEFKTVIVRLKKYF